MPKARVSIPNTMPTLRTQRNPIGTAAVMVKSTAASSTASKDLIPSTPASTAAT